ncbi:MAG: ATP-grasp domain-containing protein, partial [Pseudomonadota bacterium]
HPLDEATERALQMGLPVLVRPSYVLGGRAMEIVRDETQLQKFLIEALAAAEGDSVQIDDYLQDAIEVDVDALSDGEDVYVAGIMEHIEEAGIHSGDSACVLPAHSLPSFIIGEIERQTRDLAKALNVVGLMNVQFAVREAEIYILEVNPRASRTVPFVSKTIGAPIAQIAARLMAGEKLDAFSLPTNTPSHVAVKEAVFPFARFPGVDTILGPEMRSTGEVMGIDRGFEAAFAKSQLAGGTLLPRAGTVFISVKDADKQAAVAIGRQLTGLGFEIMATRGTARWLEAADLSVMHVKKVLEGQPHVVDYMLDGKVQLVINTTEGAQSYADSFTIRRTALTEKIPYYTTIAGARAASQALAFLETGALEVSPLQAYT